MLSIAGPGIRLCQGITRREALRIGGLGMGGLTLPQLLRAEQAAGVAKSPKSIIMIYMCGAPPHQDMYDLKMDAPSGIRGEFRPIPTAVPGIEICEHLPGLAKVMDRCVPLRSVYGSPDGDHNSFICYTGRSPRNQPAGDWPSIGSVISELNSREGAANRRASSRVSAVPKFVGLSPVTGHPPYGSPGHPGFLGVKNAAFRPSGDSRANMVLNGVSMDRLNHRRQLLGAFDRLREEIDGSGNMAGMGTLNAQALEILTSRELVDALDLNLEPTAVRQRYGTGDANNYGDGAPRNQEHFLVARRLIEAGARVVTLNFGRWDFHDNNFSECKNTHFPQFDQGLSALIEDLDQRGMLETTAVVAWGEFGRTPQINPNGGRDHWPQVGGGLIAGGGFRTGQVIGATDRIGAEIANRPVHFGEVFATLYKWLGLDLADAMLTDLSGRPQYLVDGWEPMRELI